MTNKIKGDFLIENLKDENSANDYTLRAGSAAGVVPFYLRAHKGPGSVREPIPPPPPPFHEVLAGIATPTLSYRFADGTNHGSFGSGADLTITSDGSKASFVSDESTYARFIGYFDIPDLSGESSGVRDGDQVAATPSIAVSNFNRRSSGAAATRSWIVVWYQASAFASGRDIFKGSHTTGGAGRIVTTTNSFTTAKSSIGAGPEMLAANATGSVGSAETLSNTSGKLCIVMDAWDGTDLTTYWKQTGHGVGHTKLLQPSAGNNSNSGNNAWYAAGDVNYVAYPMRTLHHSIVNSTLTADNFDTLCAAAGL